ncbi:MULTISPECIES: response regulator [Flavobacterium]|uniref:Response regulator n=1 Tax=Flavobacterium endoglycinae TaxID=2816357 RepID=A0ABX7QF76_9FLAO|nr:MULTISPECIES: response regulator [Flavobacterium]QSW89293.1 response regulator [Flavobacterium endoglycinae]
MKKIILLADDDRDDTEMFCEALGEIDENIKCHCAENGSEALQILNTLDEAPSVIFLDLNMPIMNGWDCLKELKSDKRYKDVPVIMISTSSHKNDMDTASKLGAICYFVKPNNFKDLKQVLHSITSNLESSLKDTILSLHSGGSRHVFYLG